MTRTVGIAQSVSHDTVFYIGAAMIFDPQWDEITEWLKACDVTMETGRRSLGKSSDNHFTFELRFNRRQEAMEFKLRFV